MLLPVGLLPLIALVARRQKLKRSEALRGKVFDSSSGTQDETDAAKARRSHEEGWQALPAGWEIHETDEGEPYYFHVESGVSQWEPPLTSDTVAAEATLEQIVLEQGLVPTEPLAPQPPGAADVYTELAAVAQRYDSLALSRRSRRRSSVAQRVRGESLAAPEVDEAMVLAQRAAEEAQAAARLQRAAAQEHFDAAEVAALVSHLNTLLAVDADVSGLLPLSPASLVDAAAGSLLLAKFLLAVEPEAIDLRALNTAPAGATPDPRTGAALSAAARLQNHTLVVNALGALGCGLPHLQPEQLEEAAGSAENEAVLHTLLWNVTSYELLAPLTPKQQPELLRLALPDEDAGGVAKLLPEQLTLRWINHHIRTHLAAPAYAALATAERPVPPGYAVANLGDDLRDGLALSLVMRQLRPAGAVASDWHVLKRRSAPPPRRAVAILADATALGVCRFLITPDDIVAGRPRLLQAFLAELIHACPGLDAMSEETLEEYVGAEIDAADNREESTYKCWLTSLGVPLESNDLLEDCRDGLPLLRIMDKLQPGAVDWAQVNAKPRSVYERVENCNYALERAKALGMKVMGIGGKDIADGSTKLTLAILWQLMRADVMKFLSSLGMSEREIVRWANHRVASSGSPLRIKRCGDVALRSGVFLLRLLRVVAPECVDEAEILGGGTAHECKLNAQYAVSCAHKMGCRVFLGWEDIVQVRPKMILTLLAAAMQHDMLHRSLGRDEMLQQLEGFEEDEADAEAVRRAGGLPGGAEPDAKGEDRASLLDLEDSDAAAATRGRGCLHGLLAAFGLQPPPRGPAPPPNKARRGFHLTRRTTALPAPAAPRTASILKPARESTPAGVGEAGAAAAAAAAGRRVMLMTPRSGCAAPPGVSGSGGGGGGGGGAMCAAGGAVPTLEARLRAGAPPGSAGIADGDGLVAESELARLGSGDTSSELGAPRTPGRASAR